MKTVTIKHEATGLIAYMDGQPLAPSAERLADLKRPTLQAIATAGGKVIYLRPAGVQLTSPVTLYDCRPERSYRAGLWTSS
ncbi:hypothetical protein [Bordetella bronchiseptica]|uniref:hypothetical protein n=1 Tax=Bordetella bronchiseptica TaxID=518 RepID=UPI001245F6FB|nr:hypothetical protein [Bordetella bronchiseptica]KAB1444177.1 hypothetical protein F7D00_21185 [Bordetella bronchiseptica]KAB1569283.1 hypothetical protein F7890_21185 [Bordetella bronchiseptica]